MCVKENDATLMRKYKPHDEISTFEANHFIDKPQYQYKSVLHFIIHYHSKKVHYLKKTIIIKKNNHGLLLALQDRFR